jgi:hypothetical protein
MTPSCAARIDFSVTSGLKVRDARNDFRRRPRGLDFSVCVMRASLGMRAERHRAEAERPSTILSSKDSLGRSIYFNFCGLLFHEIWRNAAARIS